APPEPPSPPVPPAPISPPLPPPPSSSTPPQAAASRSPTAARAARPDPFVLRRCCMQRTSGRRGVAARVREPTRNPAPRSITPAWGALEGREGFGPGWSRKGGGGDAASVPGEGPGGLDDGGDAPVDLLVEEVGRRP